MPKQLNIPLEKLDAYLNHLEADYQKNGFINPKKFQYSIGSTYIHVYSVDGNTSTSHSWIVNKEGSSFPLGTILKSASWRGPSRNYSRGNVLTGDFSRAYWTGVK